MLGRAIALAAVAGLVEFATATSYSLTAFAPGEPVDGMEINAAGRAFYTGMNDTPAAFCPDTVGESCPPVQGTLVWDLLTGLAVEVPGGQYIYIEEQGAVRYTAAHSNDMPPTAMQGGWYNKTMLTNCAPGNTTIVDWISPTPSDQTRTGGIFLCNATSAPDVPKGATHQLYVWTWFFNRTDCYDVIGLLEHGVDAPYGAWQYT